MLNAETIEEYSKRQQSQNKKIKLLKSKIQILEKSLSQIVQDFEKEKVLLKKQNEEVISNQRDELDMLKEDSRQKSKELKMLKSLAAVVIEQRSDIEQFFLEALEQIKEEIRKKVSLTLFPPNVIICIGSGREEVKQIQSAWRLACR